MKKWKNEEKQTELILSWIKEDKSFDDRNHKNMFNLKWQKYVVFMCNPYFFFKKKLNILNSTGLGKFSLRQF